MFENACNKYALMVIYRWIGKVLKKVKEMKKFSGVKFKSWFTMNKMESWELASLVNASYKFEVVQESEKAVKLHVFDPNRKLSQGWTKWYPKSLIENLEYVLGQERGKKKMKKYLYVSYIREYDKKDDNNDFE